MSPWLVQSRDDSGEIVDFVIEYVNSHDSSGARRGGDLLVGQLICEIHPDWRASGMFDRFRDVVETGIPYQGHRVQYADAADTQQRASSSETARPGLGDRRTGRSRSPSSVMDTSPHRATSPTSSSRRKRRGQRRCRPRPSARRSALLQAAALPTTLPALPGVRIAAVYEPADPRQPVGGDWYDVFALSDNRVALVIADVAGHGHRAAVFMVQVRNVFRAIAAEHTEPDDVLIRANDVTARLNEPDGPFVTCCFAVLDIAARTLRWAQAGHFSPLIVLADGTSTYLDERPGAPLALFEGAALRIVVDRGAAG